MKSLEELLKESGQTDEQIKATVATLGPARGLFETQLQAADQANQDAARKLTEAAEKERRINEFWNSEATPQINKAFSEKATAEAQAEFYRKQAESAKASGFIAADAPGYTAPSTAPVANSNPVPGSPAYMTLEQGVAAIGETAYLLTEHQRLFGEPLPDLSELMREGARRGAGARAVWNEKYKVEERRQKLSADAEAKKVADIRAQVEKEVKTEYASKYGNENTRPMQASRFPNYAKDPVTGAPDKLAWAKPDAKEKFKEKIHAQVAKETGTVQ